MSKKQSSQRPASKNTKRSAKASPPKPVNANVKNDYTIYLLIAGMLLTLIVYLPSLSNGITNWDDDLYINNSLVKNLTPSGIRDIFTMFFVGNYHPLTVISIGIDRLIGGDGPFIFHLTNLILHLFNSFFVFLLVKQLTRNNLLAALTSMIFGVHALHVESVAWIAERKDVLYSFFYLLSLILYTIYASGRKGIYYWFSLLIFLLSLLSKGQAVVLVTLLPFIDYVKGRRWFSTKVLLEKVPFLILSLLGGWIAVLAQSSVGAIHLDFFSLPERFAFACYDLTQYLIKSILPFGLLAFYPYPARLLNGNIPSFYWFFILLLPVFLTASYFLCKRSKVYAFGLFMFFINIILLLQ